MLTDDRLWWVSLGLENGLHLPISSCDHKTAIPSAPLEGATISVTTPHRERLSTELISKAFNTNLHATLCA